MDDSLVNGMGNADRLSECEAVFAPGLPHRPSASNPIIAAS
jgi:hypothetical protein